MRYVKYLNSVDTAGASLRRWLRTPSNLSRKVNTMTRQCPDCLNSEFWCSCPDTINERNTELKDTREAFRECVRTAKDFQEEAVYWHKAWDSRREEIKELKKQIEELKSGHEYDQFISEERLKEILRLHTKFIDTWIDKE